MRNLAIFASGSGTNAENICEYFKNDPKNSVKIILTNKKDAFVIERAKKYGIPYRIFNREEFYNQDIILNLLKDLDIDLVVLAGFLWLIPEKIINTFPDRIINIHPALLPKYGGKGMYGGRVHEAVVNNHEPESGISIHYVNKEYDKGNIIFQAKCSISKADTPEDVAQKVHQLEYKHYPAVIRDVLEKL